jgi:hypothetical protein
MLNFSSRRNIVIPFSSLPNTSHVVVNNGACTKGQTPIISRDVTRHKNVRTYSTTEKRFSAAQPCDEFSISTHVMVAPLRLAALKSKMTVRVMKNHLLLDTPLLRKREQNISCSTWYQSTHKKTGAIGSVGYCSVWLSWSKNKGGPQGILKFKKQSSIKLQMPVVIKALNCFINSPPVLYIYI